MKVFHVHSPSAFLVIVYYIYILRVFYFRESFPQTSYFHLTTLSLSSPQTRVSTSAASACSSCCNHSCPDPLHWSFHHSHQQTLAVKPMGSHFRWNPASWQQVTSSNTSLTFNLPFSYYLKCSWWFLLYSLEIVSYMCSWHMIRCSGIWHGPLLCCPHSLSNVIHDNILHCHLSLRTC